MTTDKKILLDAGHGGTDCGAIGCGRESDITLSIVLLVGRQLREKGFNVLFTRDRDKYISPTDRLRMINNLKPEVFVSIHCNASTNHGATGIETIYRDENDKPLAVALHKSMVEVEGLRDRGVKQDEGDLGRKLAVLGNLAVPACLCEVGFLTNPDDFKHISNYEEIARAIVEGVEAWSETT